MNGRGQRQGISTARLWVACVCCLWLLNGCERMPLEECERAVVRVSLLERDSQGDVLIPLGTGFFVDTEKAYLVTNNHVITEVLDKRENLRIETYDKQKLSIEEFVLKDEHKDIAILRVKPVDLPALAIAGRYAVEKGDQVIAFGYTAARMLHERRVPALNAERTEGTISATDGANQFGTRYYQHTAPINPGNSGGPLLNEWGLVVGVNTATVRLQPTGPDGGALPIDNVGFALQGDELIQILDAQRIPYRWVSRKPFEMGQPLLLIAVAGSCLLAAVSLYVAFSRDRRAAVARAASTVSRQMTTTLGLRGAGMSLPVLIGEAGEHTGKHFAVAGGVRIGRDAELCNLVVERSGGKVSKIHAQLTFEPRRREFVLEDFYSKNGTYLQHGGRIAPGQPVRLRRGDCFHLGDRDCVFRVDIE